MANGKEVQSTSVFTQTLEAAAKLPGVRISRKDYLRAALRPYCSEDQITLALDDTPAAAGVPLNVLDKIAKSSIRLESAKVSALSALAGLPGGLAMAGAVPADVLQYFGHVLRIAQKLAYLYGWPDLFSTEDGMDDATESVLTLFVGVMFGVQAAHQGVAKLSAHLAKQAAIKLPQKALMKGTIYPIVKKVAAQLSVKMTRDIFAKGVAKVIPVVGAVFAGGLTLATFTPMAHRLRKHLASLELTKPDRRG